MNLISRLSTKIKVLILVAYTFIAVLIAFLIATRGTKNPILTEYSTSAKDEYIHASFRVQENRKSSTQANDTHENSVFVIYAYIQKNTPSEGTKVALDDIRIYVAGENKNGKLLFDEGTSSKSISKTGTVASFATNMIPNNIFTVKYGKDGEKETLIDNAPVKLFFTVKYKVTVTVGNTETNAMDKTLKYSVDLSDMDKRDLSKITEERYLDKTTNRVRVKNANGSLVTPGELYKEPYDLEIKRTLVESQTSVNKDRISIKIYQNGTALGLKKFKQFKIEVFGKVKNDSTDVNNEFSDYIRLYSYCGSVINSTYATMSPELDKGYELSEFYVLVSYEYESGETKDIAYVIKNVEYVQ